MKMAQTDESFSVVLRKEKTPILPRLLIRIKEKFKHGSLGSDLYGVETIQYLFGLMEGTILSSPRSFKKLSIQKSIIIIKQLSEIVQTWEPLRLPISDYDISNLWSLNLPSCFHTAVDYVKRAKNRLVDLLDGSDLDVEEDSVLFHLTTIFAKMERADDLVKSKFASLPPFQADISTEFHFKMASLHEWKELVSSEKCAGLIYFLKHGIPVPTTLKPVNSQIHTEITKTTLKDLLKKSTDPICQICHEELNNGQNLGFVLICNHICCSHCMETWFETALGKYGKWICAACRQPVVEWGEVRANGQTNLVHLLFKKVHRFTIPAES